MNMFPVKDERSETDGKAVFSMQYSVFSSNSLDFSHAFRNDNLLLLSFRAQSLVISSERSDEKSTFKPPRFPALPAGGLTFEYEMTWCFLKNPLVIFRT